MRGKERAFGHVHIQERGSQLLARCPYGSPEQRSPGYPHRLHGRSPGLSRCDCKRLSGNNGPALHRTSGTQLNQVCRQQESERVHEGSETCISGRQ